MTVGTQSVLYGAHAFWLHPWCVALAWYRLYGFPWDPRLWVAFFVHDIGYVGKPNMDGDEGELHPLLGARIMSLFDWWALDQTAVFVTTDGALDSCPVADRSYRFGTWGQFALLHSRYFSKRLGLQPSRLCIADKLALALTPWWLYLPMVRASGEVHEYLAQAQYRIKGNEAVNESERSALLSGEQKSWYLGVQAYMRRWVAEHKDGGVDTWTSSSHERATVNEQGVWK
jgi:hypothetical protein